MFWKCDPLLNHSNTVLFFATEKWQTQNILHILKPLFHLPMICYNLKTGTSPGELPTYIPHALEDRRYTITVSVIDMLYEAPDLATGQTYFLF